MDSRAHAESVGRYLIDAGMLQADVVHRQFQDYVGYLELGFAESLTALLLRRGLLDVHTAQRLEQGFPFVADAFDEEPLLESDEELSPERTLGFDHVINVGAAPQVPRPPQAPRVPRAPTAPPPSGPERTLGFDDVLRPTPAIREGGAYALPSAATYAGAPEGSSRTIGFDSVLGPDEDEGSSDPSRTLGFEGVLGPDEDERAPDPGRGLPFDPTHTTEFGGVIRPPAGQQQGFNPLNTTEFADVIPTPGASSGGAFDPRSTMEFADVLPAPGAKPALPSGAELAITSEFGEVLPQPRKPTRAELEVTSEYGHVIPSPAQGPSAQLDGQNPSATLGFEEVLTPYSPPSSGAGRVPSDSGVVRLRPDTARLRPSERGGVRPPSDAAPMEVSSDLCAFPELGGRGQVGSFSPSPGVILPPSAEFDAEDSEWDREQGGGALPGAEELFGSMRDSERDEGPVGISTAEGDLVDLDDSRDEEGFESFAPVEPPPLGSTLGKYELVSELGTGAMGNAYACRHVESGEPFAIKVLQVVPTGRARRRERFRREVQIMQHLEHPNVVKVHGFGKDGPYDWFVMDLVEGVSLDQACKSRDFEGRLELFAQLCEGMAHAHEHDVVHRDLKPGNVLVDAEGRVRVLDFGLARVTDEESAVTVEGTSLGTPYYMSPELIRSPKKAGPESDVFCLGTVLYEITTGKRPFTGKGAGEVLNKILSEDAPKPSTVKEELPRQLDRVFAKSHEKKTSERYANAGELLLDVRALQASLLKPKGGVGVSKLKLGLLVGAIVLMIALAAYVNS